ncbi:hypothetical protein [Mucilaginibacter sp.]|uniref:hypothetical protein n=1 Tax=Mucilaginibacter sp. TaxID=1882438 RepID=UPI0025D5BC5E|nr:hypothetical protein [Mucilaginibacter sp.]
MKKSTLVTLFLVCVTTTVLSQSNANNIWRLTIADSLTLKGIERATVSGINTGSYITGADGVINIDKNNIGGKSITVSCVGYKTLYYKPGGKYPDTLMLSAITTALHEVTINSKPKGTPFGNINLQATGGYLFATNEEIAEYIPNNDKLTGTVTAVEYVLLNNHKGIERAFRVTLYSKVKDSMEPGEPLIKDTLIVYNQKKLPVFRVDISKYNIQLPEDGLFIGIETLSRERYGTETVNDHGSLYPRVPGIKGVFKGGNFRYDDIPRNGVKYAVYRSALNVMEWSVFEDGTNFAIGAVIN